MSVVLDLLFHLLFYMRVVLRGVWCFMMIIIFVVAYYGMIIPMLPFRWLWPRLWWGFEGKLYRWLMGCVGYWGYTAGYDVIEFGDDLTHCCEDRAVVICNHQSTADVPTLLVSLQQKGVACRKTMWVVAGMFKWSPFGVVGQVHGDHFIWEGKHVRDKEVERLTKHLRSVFWDRDRRWVVVFPEGGFLYKRLESSQKYAKANNYPVLKYVTLPRIGAFKAILEAIGPKTQEPTNGQTNGGNRDSGDNNTAQTTTTTAVDESKKNPSKLKLATDTLGAIRSKKYLKVTKPPVKYVLDVTIGYKDGVALSCDQLWFGTRRTCEDIHVYYKLYNAEDVPMNDDELLRQWLFDRFVDKEQMLEQFYRTGEFMPGEYGRRLHFPLWKILIQYLFWFAMAYFEWRVYSWLLISMFHVLTDWTSTLLSNFDLDWLTSR